MEAVEVVCPCLEAVFVVFQPFTGHQQCWPAGRMHYKRMPSLLTHIIHNKSRRKMCIPHFSRILCHTCGINTQQTRLGTVKKGIAYSF